MAQQSIEDRLAYLESKIAEYEAERAQTRALEALRTEVRELSVRYQAHEEYVSDRLDTFEVHINTRLDVMEDQVQELRGDVQEVRTGFQELQAGQQELRAGFQGLQSGQDQILAILTGKARTND
jgi:chromosome segregation ATPase